MTARTLAVELLTEELPPKSLKLLGEAFADAVEAGLESRGFLAADSAVTGYATPRRLAVSIRNVMPTARDSERVEKLMPRSVAEDAAGKPTLALRRRLEKLGRGALADCYPDAWDGPDHLYLAPDGKLECVWFRALAKGQPLERGLQDVLDEAIAKLPIAKVMSYAGPGSCFSDQKFVRPVHRLLALFGADVLPVRALGLDAGRTSGGHRFLGRRDLEVATADAYEETLRAEGKVVASFGERRAQIVAELQNAAHGASVLMPDALLDEVTALVEWPSVHAGTFDASFLGVPQECLILTMQQNQKYFALADMAGRLMNRFLLVANLDTPDPSAIIEGNERVLRARLADARFFFDHDRRTRLEARLARLRDVVYHNQLGTQAERTNRLRFLATRIAPLLDADPALADRAALLAKADLVTEMVGEFPELQGVMGRYYAQHDGEPAAVADAIAQHYWPRFSRDALPEGGVAETVALADKLETLAAMFGVGQAPTGDRDPFGLRRAALGVIRILIERRRRVSLSSIVDLAFDALNGMAAVKRQPEALLDFVYDRLRGYLREQGYTALQVAAVVDARPDAIDDLPARLAAVRAFGELPEAEALATANKRIVNILRKADAEAATAVDRGRLEAGAEHDLWLAFQKLEPTVAADCGRGDFTSALLALATAKTAVDRFFDDVLVMADDPAIRANRLALLRGVAQTMNRVADISKLAA